MMATSPTRNSALLLRTPSLSNLTEEQLEEISNGTMQRPIVATLGEIANKTRNDLLALAQPTEPWTGSVRLGTGKPPGGVINDSS